MESINNRREFLKGSLTAAAAMAGAPVLSAEPQPAARKTVSTEPLRVSVLAYSFRGVLSEGKMDLFGYLETCKYRYHLGAADLWSSMSPPGWPKWPGQNGFLVSTDEAYCKKVKDGLDQRGLELADLCVDWAELWVDDPAQREMLYKHEQAHLRAAAVLLPRFMRFDAGGRGSKDWTNEQFDYIVKRYREFAQFAYDHGFRIGAENHWGPESSWPSMQRLYKAVDHPGFAFCMHISGWQGTAAEKDLADREAAAFAAHTHIPWNVTESPALEEKLANLWNAGYQGYYNVEHHSGKDEYTEVGIQLAKVRDVLERFRTGQSTKLTTKRT